MLKVFKQKKGMRELYKMLIELLLALMVMSSAIWYGVSVGTGMRLIKEKAARDVALTVESVEAAPGSVFFSYADTMGLKYKFSRNTVDVYSGGEDTSAPSSAFYFYPEDTALKFTLPGEAVAPQQGQKKTVVSMKKNSPEFFINSYDLSLEAMNCEKINASGDLQKVIIYDSGPKKEGSAGGAGVPSVFYDEIHQSLIPKLGIIESQYDTDKDRVKSIVLQDQKSILLEIADSPGGDTDVKLYISSDKKSRALGCITRNLLAKNRISATVLAERYYDFASPVRMKAEIGSLNRELIIGTIGDAVNEYFK